MICKIFTMPSFDFLYLPFPPLLLLCSSLCVPGDAAAGAGRQLPAGGGAPGGGVVQGPAAVRGPAVRHALDPLSHRHAVRVRLLGRLQTEPSHHHLQVRAPPTVPDDQIASVLLYWFIVCWGGYGRWWQNGSSGVSAPSPWAHLVGWCRAE